jgi:hypothetical protein
VYPINDSNKFLTQKAGADNLWRQPLDSRLFDNLISADIYENEIKRKLL